jgi:hypothetical protein
MNMTEFLAAVHGMRSNPNYQQAEKARQIAGAETMAKGPPDSDNYGAVRFLIGTWETVSAMCLLLPRTERERAFEVLPICYMYSQLKPAIGIVRAGGKEPFPKYAGKFEQLRNEQDQWLDKDGAAYRSQEESGFHAMFG